MDEGETAANHRPSRVAGISSLPFRKSYQRKEGRAEAKNGGCTRNGGVGRGLGGAQCLGKGCYRVAGTHHRRRTPLPVVKVTDVYTDSAQIPPTRARLPAPHWLSAWRRRSPLAQGWSGWGQPTKARPRAGSSAQAAEPWPHCLRHAVSPDWLSRGGAEPVGVVEEPRLILGSRGLKENGGCRRPERWVLTAGSLRPARGTSTDK